MTLVAPAQRPSPRSHAHALSISTSLLCLCLSFFFLPSPSHHLTIHNPFNRSKGHGRTWHVSAISGCGAAAYLVRMSSESASPMAPSASAASCRTITSCSSSSRTALRCGMAPVSCIWPRQYAHSCFSSALSSAKPAGDPPPKKKVSKDSG